MIIDTAGCQTENARLIREPGGRYLLAVKDNQAAVEGVIERACAAEFVAVEPDGHETVEDGSGRHEERSLSVVSDPAGIPEGWPDVAAVVPVSRIREAAGKRTQTTHYDLSSHRAKAEVLGRVVRGHWGIENGLHWVLDVVYGEDDSRVRAGHAGANLGLVRRVAVALSRRAPGTVSGVTKRKMAGWDDDFMVQVLDGLSEA